MTKKPAEVTTPPPVRLETTSPGCYRLVGQLTFATVPSLVDALNGGAHPGRRVEVDLSGITLSDSAGTALLVEWVKQTRLQGLKLTYLNTPGQIQAIAKVTGLETFLSIN